MCLQEQPETTSQQHTDTRSQQPIHSDSPRSSSPFTTNPARIPGADDTPEPTRRLTTLHTKRRALETKLSTLQSERAALTAASRLPSGLNMPAEWSEEQKSKQAMAAANGVIKEHIALLHRYNEMKDMGLGLLGLVAEQRKCRVKEVLEEFGMGEKD